MIVEPELAIVLPVNDNSPNVWAPVPEAVNSPAIVTSSVNAKVTLSVAATVAVTWFAVPWNNIVLPFTSVWVFDPSEIVKDNAPAIAAYNSFTAPITDVAVRLESSVAISPKSVADRALNCTLKSSSVCVADICLAAISF